MRNTAATAAMTGGGRALQDKRGMLAAHTAAQHGHAVFLDMLRLRGFLHDDPDASVREHTCAVLL